MYAQFSPIQHPRNIPVRQTIDKARIGLDFTDKATITKAQSFIQQDSTYYVGYMYEGIYRSEKAADVFGYQNAIAPLENALRLLSKDYDALLRKRSSDYYVYYSYYTLHQDYSIIAYYLENAYAYAGQVNKAYEVIQKVIQYNFQKHYGLVPYTALAWLVHRNRFYTKAQYVFLGNSIQENETLAHAYLDSANIEIDRNITINSSVLSAGFDEKLYLNVDFYRAILYAYNLEMDSATHYYNKLYETGYVSYNNYANFKSIQGAFEEAEINYNIANYSGNSNFELKEFIYFGSVINIYKNDLVEAAYLLEQTIKDQGSTPGFGWYNLGLARVEMYNGNYDRAQQYLTKAKDFHELHIGTTLGELHYDFTRQLLQLKWYNEQIQLEKFTHKNWWYRPKSLWKIVKLYFSKLSCEQVVMDLLINNKERDLVIYTLFSTESTVSWDEIWYLLKDYSHKYFTKKYAELAVEDQRPDIIKYYKLVEAKILYEKGNIKAAKAILEMLLANDIVPVEERKFEMLYWGRVFELMGLIADEENNTTLYQVACNKLMLYYPQLFITSSLRPSLLFKAEDKESEYLVDAIDNYQINEPSAAINGFQCELTSYREGAELKYKVQLINAAGEIVKKGVLSGDEKSLGTALINFVFSLNEISESTNDNMDEAGDEV